MSASAKALFIAVYDNDEARAFETIDDAIHTYTKNNYPLLTKMDIAVRFNNREALQDCLRHLGFEVHQGSPFFNAYKRSEAVLLALDGKQVQAVGVVEKEMLNYSETAKARLLERIGHITSR